LRGPGRLVTNTAILASAGHGIDRGWRGTEVDFLGGGNTFSGITWCTQSYPKDMNGGCPDPVPCPTE
jgi:hypothetical protein